METTEPFIPMQEDATWLSGARKKFGDSHLTTADFVAQPAVSLAVAETKLPDTSSSSSSSSSSRDNNSRRESSPVKENKSRRSRSRSRNKTRGSTHRRDRSRSPRARRDADVSYSVIVYNPRQTNTDRLVPSHEWLVSGTLDEICAQMDRKHCREYTTPNGSEQWSLQFFAPHQTRWSLIKMETDWGVFRQNGNSAAPLFTGGRKALLGMLRDLVAEYADFFALKTHSERRFRIDNTQWLALVKERIPSLLQARHGCLFSDTAKVGDDGDRRIVVSAWNKSNDQLNDIVDEIRFASAKSSHASA